MIVIPKNTQDSLRSFLHQKITARKAFEDPRFKPLQMFHIYLLLDFEQRYENASTLADGTSFLKNVGKAANIADATASMFDGAVIEAQGSTIHIGIPSNESANKYCATLHGLLRSTFGASSNVNGWRMAADLGKTMLVEGQGIHGDSSWISLGRAANRPAKHLYQSKADGSLEKYYLAKRAGDKWAHVSLDEMLRQHSGEELIKNARTTVRASAFEDVTVQALNRSTSGHKVFNREHGMMEAKAQAAPVRSPQETGDAPDNNRPDCYFGWVMRADLDGFTRRVEECFDDDDAMRKLAKEFTLLMDKAAEFANAHEELLIQLPWAGDNFTAVATFSSKEDYEEARKEKLVNFSLDFDERMHKAATDCGFGGWGQGVAGGEIHGNAVGNVFLGSVEIGGRRALLGAGMGIGMSLKAFVAVNPEPQEIALLKEDSSELHDAYRKCFMSPEMNNGQGTTHFKTGKCQDLLKAKYQLMTSPKETVITTAPGVLINHKTSNHYSR